MADSEGWDTASFEELAIEQPEQRKSISDTRLIILHQMLLAVRLVHSQKNYLRSRELNDHEKARDVIERRNVILQDLPSANILEDSPVYSDMQEAILTFVSLNMNLVHSRIYFVIGKHFEAFIEHQVVSKVVEHKRKYQGNVFSIDWQYDIVDQTAVFGRNVKHHRVFSGVLEAIKAHGLKQNCPLSYPRASVFLELNSKRLSAIPKTKESIKIHPHYTTEGNCKRNEVVYPKRPVVGEVKGEQIFLRRNVLKLRTAGGWYRHGMIIAEGSKPYRIANGKRLYAPFQASRLSVPTISSRRMDAFHPNMTPLDSVYLREASDFPARLGIEYAECVVGFYGREPVLKGYFIHKRYAFIVNELLRERDYFYAVISSNKLYESTMKVWHVLLRRIQQYIDIKKHLGME